jgi:perosamine synthetase
MIKSSHKKFNGNELRYIKESLDNGLKSSKEGSFNLRLENLWSKFHNTKHSITINSCTSALHVSLLAMGAKKGDEILVPSLTPIMCGTSIHFTGATPVYVDVDKETFLMCPSDLEKKITNKTKGLILVHMYGGINNIKLFHKIAKKYKIFVIEDCAEALGAKDQDGILAGSTSDINCWSFQSAKHITCGDGGMISTNNKNIAIKLRKFSNLGFKFLNANSGQVGLTKYQRQDPKFKRFDEIGFNYRLNEFSAAIALAQFEKLTKFLNLRRKMGIEIEKLVKNCSFLESQKISQNTYSTYYTAAVKITNRKVKWQTFKKMFIKNGGIDGIYAAAQLLQNEPIIQKKSIGKCFKNCKVNCVRSCKGTPNSKNLQKSLLLFTTNQNSELEIKKQATALKKTISYFDSLI